MEHLLLQVTQDDLILQGNLIFPALLFFITLISWIAGCAYCKVSKKGCDRVLWDEPRQYNRV